MDRKQFTELDPFAQEMLTRVAIARIKEIGCYKRQDEIRLMLRQGKGWLKRAGVPESVLDALRVFCRIEIGERVEDEEIDALKHLRSGTRVVTVS